jgi:hypothetical protein
MGHVRLGVLPESRKWTVVVQQLFRGGPVAVLAALASKAAEANLEGASGDPAFLHSFWLLTQVPLAARSSAFAQDLRRLGLEVPDQPSLMDIASAFSAAVDQYARKYGGRTDLGEMAQLAAVETLTATVGPTLSSLFEATPGEVQRAIGRFASVDRFGRLAREFFARLMQRCLDYYLSRELGNHIGTSFRDDRARSRFDSALWQHCREASCFVEAFAGGWYGKNIYQGDGVTPELVRKFAPVAFRKIRAELRKHQDANQ